MIVKQVVSADVGSYWISERKNNTIKPGSLDNSSIT